MVASVFIATKCVINSTFGTAVSVNYVIRCVMMSIFSFIGLFPLIHFVSECVLFVIK